MTAGHIKSLIEKSVEKKGFLWFAIVDEEGDITYYVVDIVKPKGNVKSYKYPKIEGLIVGNRTVIFDKKVSKNLFEKEFFGKKFGEGLQLSMVETLYLMDKKMLDVKKNSDKGKISYKKLKEHIKNGQPDVDLRLVVFNDLKKKGLIVKTGFKFGTHFRVYTKKPDQIHAEYLVHVVDKGFKSVWSEVSRAVRLAHSVNKEILFARVVGKKVEYVCFGRLRP